MLNLGFFLRSLNVRFCSETVRGRKRWQTEVRVDNDWTVGAGGSVVVKSSVLEVVLLRAHFVGEMSSSCCVGRLSNNARTSWRNTSLRGTSSTGGRAKPSVHLARCAPASAATQASSRQTTSRVQQAPSPATQHVTSWCAGQRTDVERGRSQLPKHMSQSQRELPSVFTTWCYAVVVCLSVCLSVTSRHCTKTAKHRIKPTMPYDSPRALVFWCQSYRRNSNGEIPYGAPNRGGVGSDWRFLSNISLYLRNGSILRGDTLHQWWQWWW